MPKAKKEGLVWTVGMTTPLRNLAAIGANMREVRRAMPERTPKQIKDRLAELELDLNPDTIADIRRAGRKGVVFLREDLGGAIGVRWLCAHRSGAAFDTQKMEALLEAKFVIPAYAAQVENHFMWADRD